MSMTLKFEVNGKLMTDQVDPNRMLLHYLREDLGLVGTKNGCGSGHCGTCTVLIDDEPKKSCIVKLKNCEGKKIETIENLSRDGKLHPIQQTFMDEGAIQCGFCTPGMIMTAKSLLTKVKYPNDSQIRVALKDNLCRCTGYGAIFRAVKKAAVMINGVSDDAQYLREPLEFEEGLNSTQAVGKSVIKKDAHLKVTGGKVFAGDYQTENQLYGKIVFSEYAHAKILEIDTADAEKVEGVVKIATYKDVLGLNKFGLFVPEQPVLAQDEVKYFGDCVACVYAESEEAALKACNKIKVSYELLPTLLSAEENFKEEAMVLRSGKENNIVHHVSVRKGDTESAFEKADVIIENTYQTQAVEHGYLEPEACLADYIGDTLVIYTGNQGSEAYKDMISRSLNIPKDKVRVVLTATGGGFGGKEEPTVQILAALGTLMSKRPVKMVLTRKESIRMTTKRHPMKIKMKHGITHDGHIVAMTSHVIADAGAYESQTKPVIFRSAVTASGPYHTDTVSADSYGVCTHKNPSGAFRGFGSTQASFACESQMDQLAQAIGISPYELRRLNGFKEGSVTSTGQVLRDGIGYIGTLEAANDGLKKMKAEFENDERPGHIKLGFGIASAYKNVGIGTGIADKAGADIEIKETGRIEVRMGAADMGQGVDTLVAQIASETLGVSYDLIDVIACDTEICPDGGMTTASRQTYVTGNAVKIGAERFLEQTQMSLSAFENDAVMQALNKINSEPIEKQVNILKNLWKVLMKNDCSTQTRFDYYPPKTYPHRTDANHKLGDDLSTFDIHYAYCFASASVALEVNTLNGAVKVLKVCAAQDVGKAIHPKNVVGQIEGAVAMGIGLALSEEFIVDDERIYQDDLRKLQLINSVNMPPVESIIIEEVQIEGPYGAKGMGEVGLNPIAPAIANAIFDAVGVRLRTLPMKPASILKALGEKG